MKMAKPEMTVVRFNESDVIVASGGGSGYVASPTSLLATNFGDGVQGNGVINYNGTDYLFNKNNQGNVVNNAIRNALGLNKNISLRDNDGTVFSNIYYIGQQEYQKTGYGINVDGIYLYDTATKDFIRQ